jgi:hypothetical protein
VEPLRLRPSRRRHTSIPTSTAKGVLVEPTATRIVYIAQPGREIAKLVGHGFVEISTANGHDYIAKVTRAGRNSTRKGFLGMTGLVALFSIAMIGYLYGCGVSDD